MTPRDVLLNAHLRAGLCWPEAQLRASAKHWPEDATLAWLLRNPQRGNTMVPDADSLYRAFALLSRDADGRCRVTAALRVIVLRAARVHAATACAAAGLDDHAAALRALPDDAEWSVISAACDRAVNAASAASAVRAVNAANAASAVCAASAVRAVTAVCAAALWGTDAELRQQVVDLADAADGWVPQDGACT